MIDPSFTRQLVLGESSSSGQKSSPSISTEVLDIENVSDPWVWTSIVPTCIACCLLLSRAFQQLPYRPVWSRNFVQEETDSNEALDSSKSTKSPSLLLFAFLILSLFGLISQVVASFLPVVNLTSLPRALTWAVLLLLIAIDRPKIAPLGVLLILCSIVLSQLLLLVYISHQLSAIDIHRGCEVVVALGSIALILCMPLRDPRLGCQDISPAYEKPDHQRRSPEDNLTLWQFMSVSWMSPMIAIGSTRQLNHEDVWQLGLQFQHRILHDKFRELRGSVVRRLLVANGLDLVILLCLGILEAFSNFAGPVLLQQLLRAMQNTLAPRSRAVIFAVLSLLVRLIACQSSVFSLWYSRRSYERSRGEMITMLYEKTLSRQIVGESASSDTLKPSDEEPNYVISDSDVVIEPQGAFKTTLKKVRMFGRSLRSLVWSRSPSQLKQQPASIDMTHTKWHKDFGNSRQSFECP